MAIHAPITAASLCASPVRAFLSQFDRAMLERFVEAGIALLDAIDGDADLELNGDEHDHNGAEDDFVDWRAGASHDGIGPGCPIADPGGDPLDQGELDETRGLLPPRYGIDQSRGPINERAVVDAWHRQQQSR